MKAKFTINTDLSITLEYDNDFSGTRNEATFFVPATGGYVRETTRSGAIQVCEKLSNRGVTLMCSSPLELPALIRREYRKMRAYEKRQMES